MPKFSCKNKDCKKEKTENNVKYKWNNDTKNFVPVSLYKCPDCGSLMEEVIENKSLSSINFSYRQQMNSDSNYKGHVY